MLKFLQLRFDFSRSQLSGRTTHDYAYSWEEEQATGTTSNKTTSIATSNNKQQTTAVWEQMTTGR
jgi:hypothetical protein